VRAARRFDTDRTYPRLARSNVADRVQLFTEAVARPPPVYGERWVELGARAFRAFEPGRSKLAAAILHRWTGPVPTVEETWLYLGAASGTTASHVADLVGPAGRVYALERSPRSFARLLSLAERWPNLLPILADARAPRAFAHLVPPVRGIYADIAQPDQVAIARENAALFLDRPGAAFVMALKTPSMGRDAEASGHLADAERALRGGFDLAPSVELEPFHRGHYLVGGRARAELFGERPRLTLARPRAPRPGRRAR